MAEEKVKVSEEVSTPAEPPAAKPASGKWAEKSTRSTLDRKP